MVALCDVKRRTKVKVGGRRSAFGKLTQSEVGFIQSEINLRMRILDLSKLYHDVICKKLDGLLVLVVNLELESYCVLMESNLGASVRFCQGVIKLLNKGDVGDVYWMRVPGVTIINHKLLWKTLHERMRDVLLLDHTLDIGELREEKGRLQIAHFGVVCGYLFH
jgi:hypothetical protein